MGTGGGGLVNFTPIEIALCKAWAEENAGEDDPMDVFHWKLLENGQEKSDRSARFHGRVVAEIKTEMEQLSSRFYKSESPDPNGDEGVDF
tara:strand:+ start:2073 stop:2342 length:270 start_codon:yes stop_codon:yes gene_type:complete